MTTALEQILKDMEKYNAENESIEAGGPADPYGGVGGSHAACQKNLRESMKALAAIWKAKAASLASQGDPNPKYNAAVSLTTQYRNVQAAYDKCMRSPLHKLKTPGPGDKF